MKMALSNFAIINDAWPSDIIPVSCKCNLKFDVICYGRLEKCLDFYALHLI